MSIDSNARYAESHEYARLDSGKIVVGISDHAQEELGDIVFVELPAKGKLIKKGQVFGTVESVKAASDLYMPVGGTIVEVNETLQADPALVNREPYAGGWMIKVQPSDLKEMDALMDAAAYAKSVGEA
jgi:glycine cleavage system H protein